MLCPPSGDLPNPGIEPGSPARQANSLPAELPGNFLGDFFFWGGDFFFFGAKSWRHLTLLILLPNLWGPIVQI